MTDPTRMEADPGSQEGTLRDFVLAFADWIWETDPDGRIVSCTDGVRAVSGMSPELLTGRSILEILAGSESDSSTRSLGELMERRLPLRDLVIRRQAADGRRVCILTGGVPVFHRSGRFLGYRGIARDVTQVMDMERALRTQEAFVERLFDSAAEGIVLVDNSGVIVKVNQAFLEMFGWSEAEVLGRGIDQVVCRPDLVGEASEITTSVIAGRRVAVETERVRKDGSTLQVFLVAAPIETGDGQIGFFGIYSDVTAWKKAQEELREQTRFLSSLLENLPGMVYRCSNDEHWTMEFVSRGCYLLTGHRPEDLVRNSKISYASLILPEDRAMVAEAVASGLRKKDRFEMSYRIRRPSGEIRWVHENGSGVFDSDGGVVALEGFITDVTDTIVSEEQLRQSRLRIEKLHEVAIALEACRTEAEACRLAVDAAEHILGFAICSVDLVDGDFFVTIATSRSGAAVNREKTPIGDGLAGRTYSSGKTIRSGNLADEPGAKPVTRDLMSVVSSPIADFGVFQAVSNSADAFSDDEVSALELLLGHTAEALRRLRLEGRLREQAVRDPLTGLYNRNYFSEFMEHESHRAARYGRRVGFLMIDLDDFKHINDHFGHPAGDRYLQTFAQYLLGSVRKADIVVRYGGDEFLIVLPETDGEAKLVMDRLERNRPGSIEVSGSDAVPVSFSIGCSYWLPGNDETVWQALERADTLMYRAKREGRPESGIEPDTD